MRKRILFLIYSSSNKAGGGHYYSLLTLLEFLGDKIDFKVLNVGETHATTLRKGNSSSDFIKMTKSTFAMDLFKVHKYITSYNPDIIHAFDYYALLVAKSLQIFLKKPLIFQKCGGVNGIKQVPFADSYICFSEENRSFMIKHKRNSKSVHLIPNRAKSVICDSKRIDSLISNYKLESKKILMRISRISSMHELSLSQSINMLKFLHRQDKSYTLLIIGIVQEEDVLNRLNYQSFNYPVLFITQDYFTNKASDLLCLADIVIATGRGVMEAASLGKKIFCPVKNAKYPAPLNKENLDQMMSLNFSGRIKNIDSSEEIILKSLERDIYNSQAFMLNLFKEKFDVTTVIPQYLNIYHNIQFSGFSMLKMVNYIINMLYYFKPSWMNSRIFKIGK